jgi:hypothetical protein
MKPTVSLFLIDTCSPGLARNALRMCLEQHQFDRVVVFTDTPDQFGGIPTVGIPTLNSQEAYGNFVIHHLPQFIETDFILIAHYDGFILNGDQFSPHFYHYDYIGAPWHWTENAVGNGGFSWRSKKLCLAAREVGVGISMKEPEDAFICREKRGILEQQYGCSFPDVGLASHFSFETMIPRFRTFGFHGAFHLPALYRENLGFLLENLPDRLLVEEDPAAAIFFRHLGAVAPGAVEQYREVIARRGEQARSRRS